jgi:CelD/BcsL family acetyltransferase involved in cellulose biosynthesis
MTEVLEINRLDQLTEQAPCWQSLLDRTPGATFFHCLDWLRAYWEHFGTGKHFRVLVVSHGGEPVGILPLVVRAAHSRLGSVRTLTYPLDDWGSFYGPVGPEPEATLAAGLAHVARTRRDWSALELRWIPPEAAVLEATERAYRAAGFHAYRTAWDRTAVIHLEDDWDTYLAARPRKWRENYRRAERRLADRGEVSHVRHRPAGAEHGDGDPRWDLYDACEELAARTWQASATDGTTLSDASVRAFLRDSHAAAARRGEVDLNLLLVDGRPAAFAYNYYWRGSVYGVRAGFDPATRDGAGHVLSARMIRDSFARGDRHFDLGAGHFGTKRHLATDYQTIYRVSHFPLGGPRTQLLRLRRWMEARALRKDGASPLAAGV